MPFDLALNYLVGMGVWLLALGGGLAALLQLRREWARHRPSRIIWTNLGLSVWMFAAGLTVVELYFAIPYDQSDSFNMTKVSQHWFRRHVRENAEGFRDDRPLTPTPPEGQRRICFIGDSFTFGHGIKDVRDRFSDLVGKRLAEARPGKFEVANIASSGIHVQLVMGIIKAVVEHKRQIDVLVYTICLNDIEAYEPTIDDYQARLDAISPRFILFQESYFLNMLYFRVQQARLPQVRNYYAEMAESYRSTPWNGMRAKLSEIHQYCSDHGIELRIVIFPFLHNLGPDYPFVDAHQRIAEFCRDERVPFTDLKPMFDAHRDEWLMVNRFDAHPNERAHALAAEAIGKDLLGDLFQTD